MLGFTQCSLYWKFEEKKWCCTISHGCPVTSSSKSLSPEEEKGRRQQLIILCGAICWFISWCTPWLVENHSWQTQNLPCFQRFISKLLIGSTQNRERWNIEQRLNWHSGSWGRHGRHPSNLFIPFLFCYPDMLLPVTTAPRNVWYYVILFSDCWR